MKKHHPAEPACAIELQRRSRSARWQSLEAPTTPGLVADALSERCEVSVESALETMRAGSRAAASRKQQRACRDTAEAHLLLLQGL